MAVSLTLVTVAVVDSLPSNPHDQSTTVDLNPTAILVPLGFQMSVCIKGHKGWWVLAYVMTIHTESS